MITEIRNKITSVLGTVTSNFFYQVAPKGQSFPYCVYNFYANEVGDIDTKDAFEDIYFQVSSYQRTDGLVESLASSIEVAFLAGDFDTTNYTCLSKRKIKRVPFPPEIEVKESRTLITEFYIYYKKI